MTDPTTATATAPTPAASSPPSQEQQLALAVAAFNAICTHAAEGKPIERPSDLLGDLPEAFQQVDGLLVKLATTIRALASAGFITDAMPASPTALGLTVYAAGDALVQFAAAEVTTWRYKVAAAELALDLARLEIQRKDDELAAHKQRRSGSSRSSSRKNASSRSAQAR